MVFIDESFGNCYLWFTGKYTGTQKLEAHNNDTVSLMKDAELSGLRLQLQPHFYSTA